MWSNSKSNENEQSVSEEPFVADVPEQGESVGLCERFAVAIVFVIFVTFRAADRVFLKVVSNDLNKGSYNLIWSNIIWPVAIQFMTICMIMGYILVQRCMGNREYDLKFFLPGNPQASARGPVPILQLALFSIGDQLNAALSSPASPFVSQAIQSVMTNAILIWMAIIAYFWIRARFHQVHYVGMALVMMACMVQLSQKFSTNDCSPTGMENDECFSSYHSPLDGGKYVKLTVGAMILWYSLFFVSTIPAAVGNVYKQKVLQGMDVDVFYATWWSGNFQVLWGWLCIPLMWIPLPGQSTISPAETLSAFWDTLACFGGAMPHPDDGTCHTSPPPWLYLIVYLLFNLSFNMAFLWLTKRISAAWAQVATVLCLGLCNIFSTMKFIMGDSAQPLSLNDWLGIIIVGIALWVYNLESEKTADGEVTQQAVGSFVADGHANIIQKVDGSSFKGSAIKQGSVIGFGSEMGDRGQRAESCARP